jgi:hypothetical protein
MIYNFGQAFKMMLCGRVMKKDCVTRYRIHKINGGLRMEFWDDTEWEFSKNPINSFFGSKWTPVE